MNELNDALAKLSINEGKCSPQDVGYSFSIIIKCLLLEESDKNSLVELLLEKGILDSVLDVLKSQDEFSESTIIQVSKTIAELAKADVVRKMCCNTFLIEKILDLLDSKSPELVLQACRALGNICYDNEDACHLMKEKHCIGRVLQLLKTQVDGENMHENLPSVTSGCLLNLIYTCEEIQEQALESGILDILLQCLTKFYTNEEVLAHCLTVLSCLSDCEMGRKELLGSHLISLLLEFFREPVSGDIMDSILEVFGNLCENDAAKFKLSGMGLCHKLVELVKKHHCQETSPDEKSLHIFKTVPDLVILVLTGDDSMESLYDRGEGFVYKETSSWVKSQNDDLCIAGALALGNFARKDSHCIQIISNGTGEHLLSLLQKHSGNEGDIRIQHAALSALRNLSIPACNKLSLIELGIVDKLLSMMNIETFPIIFKLLGTLRMLLDGQEQVAVDVGGNAVFIKRLVEWSSTDDHPGVKGEATRILAWLVKNSCSSSVMKRLIDSDALPHIVSMLKSEHVIMQNEALIALTLMARCCTEEVEKEAEDSELCDAVVNVLTRNLQVAEVTQNTLTLISVLLESEKLQYLLKQTKLLVELGALKPSDERILEFQRKILLKMENCCS